jgi:hypothetical protein
VLKLRSKMILIATPINLFFTLAFIAFTKAQSPSNINRAVSCPTNSSIVGYTSVASLQADFVSERDAIEQGESVAQASYLFTLCPNTSFVFSNDPITPLLDQSTIRCGTSGDPIDACIFSGGATQVVVESSTLENFYAITQITFEGVSFTQFTQAAISGSALDTTTLVCIGCVFEVRPLLLSYFCVEWIFCLTATI